MDNLELDALSRNRIVADVNENFFVEAGAGSGKTTMLVNRMVAMVESGIPIDKICAITFTKAAAGVFLRRFQKILINRSNPNYKYVDKGRAGDLPAPTEETRERCRVALQNIDLCFMGTIDSFCNLVLGEHPSEAHIPSDASIVTDEEMEGILKQEFVKILGGVYGKELAERGRSFSAIHWNAEEVFVEGMGVILNNRNAHFNFEEYKPLDVDKEFKVDREELLDLLKSCYENEDSIKYSGNKDSVTAWGELYRSRNNLSKKWSLDLNGTIKALKNIESMNLTKDASEKCNLGGDRFLEMGRSALKLNIGDLIIKLLSVQYSASMTFLCQSVDYVEQSLREVGKLTFYDYLLYLRNMLREDAKKEGKLINYIYNRHSYFLIDEFQDTNPMQAEIFFYLTSEKPVPIWEDCCPRKGSLFIVGDPKQSIYRFRNADVTSFLKVKGLFENGVGEILKLTRNFRSTKADCNFFNNVFSKLLATETETQSKYEMIPLPEENKTQIFDGVYSYMCYEGDNGRETHPNLTDEKQIVKLINTLVGNKNYKILPEDEDEPREITYKDFMIITPSKTRLPRYIEALEQNNIPVRAEGKVLFEESEALKAIYSIYAAVSDKTDGIALNRALKSVLIRFTDNLLVNYLKTGRKITLSNVVYDEELPELDEKYLAVDKALDILRQLSKDSNNLSPAALFVNIMEKFEVFKYASSEHLEIVYYTLELIRSAETQGLIVSHKDGAEFMLNLINGGAEQERCLKLLEDTNCVHLANLHKVKGLEAPIVILAYAYTFKSDPSIRIEYLKDSTEGYVFAVKTKNDDSGNSYSLFETKEFDDTKKNTEKDCLKDENVRLIYVGATRARNALLVCDSVFANANGDRHTSGWSPLIKEGLPDVFENLIDNEDFKKYEASKVLATDLYNDANESQILKKKSEMKPSYELKIPSGIPLQSKVVESAEDFDLNGEMSSDLLDADKSLENEALNDQKNDIPLIHTVPDIVGTLTHMMMERNKINLLKKKWQNTWMCH